MELAKEIVGMFHGAGEAEKAEKAFVSVFSKREVPDDMPTIVVPNDYLLSEALLNDGIIKSKSDFVRLVREGAITMIDPREDKVLDIFERAKTGVYRIGKHRFVRIKQ